METWHTPDNLLLILFLKNHLFLWVVVTFFKRSANYDMNCISKNALAILISGSHIIPKSIRRKCLVWEYSTAWKKEIKSVKVAYQGAKHGNGKQPYPFIRNGYFGMDPKWIFWDGYFGGGSCPDGCCVNGKATSLLEQIF